MSWDVRTRPAIFLDRDGTVIRNVPYLRDPKQVQLLPGVGTALLQLSLQGYALILVSNQSGVGRRLLSVKELHQVHRKLEGELAEFHIHLDGAYYCPHAPWEGCDCRKPLAGMILRATQEFGIDLARSLIVGDSLTDMEAGWRAGCRTVYLIGSPLSLGPDMGDRAPDLVATDWVDVAAYARTLVEKL